MYHKLKRELFTHPRVALKHIRRFTERKARVCPFCGVRKNAEIHHTDHRGIITYRCNDCNKTFSELIGTIFYRSKIPLHKWMLLIIEWIESTGSISAAEGARKIAVSHPTAWKMLMKIRKELHKNLDKTMLTDITEADEAWMGRKDNQEIILGIVQRGRRRLRLISIPNLKEATLYPHIEANVEKGSKFFTDQRNTYAITGIYYHHQAVNHSKHEFARGIAHSNTIEQIWGWIKGIIRTIHHGVSKKYRKYYLSQFIFRYEHEHTKNMFFFTLFNLFSPTYCLI